MDDEDDDLSVSANLEAELGELSLKSDRECRRDKIRKFVDRVDKKASSKRISFPENLEWMNVKNPLSFKDQLQGKIVVLDFFTYCCINCMHVLPDLEALEDKFSVSDGLVVIGVHSAKFENEKISANILSAILRYDITHPVVNDSNAVLWQELQIPCWPTFVIVGPDGQFLHWMIGEGHREKLQEFVEVSLELYKEKNRIKCHDIPLSLERGKLDTSVLKFPGKISINENGCDELVISDTGHHRVLLVSREGIVKKCIGSGVKGFRDGHFSECQFDSPQGLVVHEKLIYIADTGNHAIRKVDLTNGQVITIAGTGKQGRDKVGGNEGSSQEISSPWDLCIGKSPNSSIFNILYIAMAGTHQIWGYFLEDGQWFRGKQYKAGTCVRLAGSGAEENRNNNYPEKAGLAQPSGITWSEQESQNVLYIADAESSTVRCMSLKDGSIKGVVGGERDPNNLFSFGDQDGIGVEAKLQHPLSVVMLNKEHGPLLVADSYNHKIKSVDITSKHCSMLLGTGNAGDKYDCPEHLVEFNEPGGMCVDERRNLLYVADTNNNCIKTVDLLTKTVKKFPIIFPDEHADKPVRTVTSPKISKKAMTHNIKNITVKSGGTLKISFALTLSEGNHLTEGAPSSWQVFSQDDRGKEVLQSCEILSGKITDLSILPSITINIPHSEGSTAILSYLNLFICDDANVCKNREYVFSQSLKWSEDSDLKMAEVTITQVIS